MEKAAPLILYYLLISKLLYPITLKYTDLLQQLKIQETWTSHLTHISVYYFAILKKKKEDKAQFFYSSS